MLGQKILDRVEAGLKSGISILNRITQQALERHGPTHLLTASRLFNPNELGKLQYSLASILGTGELLGRALVRLKARKAKIRRHADQPAHGDYIPAGVKIFTPEAALEFFLSLTPDLGVDVQRWGPELERHAFTMAKATEQEILQRCRDIVISGIQDGEPAGAQKIRGILDRAGMLPTNPQYSEMVYRTNVLDAHAVGHDREMQDPDMQETFPAWLYSAAIDENSRPWHAKRNNNLYSSRLPFALVRGTTARDVCNCRCVPIDLDRWEVDDRLAAGAKIITAIA